MPRKRKPAAAKRQAPEQPPWEEVPPGLALKLPDKLLDEIKHTNLHKLRQMLDLGPDIREWAESERQRQVGSAARPARAGQTRWRVKIPHAREAIDQMLDERKADPEKFRLVKTQVDRVRTILKTRYRVRVDDKPVRTLRRMIAERRDKSDR